MSQKIKLTLIILLGLFLRLKGIESPIGDWHSWRQADTAAVSRNYFKHGIDLLHPKFDDVSDIPSGIDNPNGYRFVEFPLGNALHAVSAKLLQNVSFEQSGRLLSVIFSLMSISLIYLITRKYYSENTALLASFIFSVMPFAVYYSRVILPEPLIITACLLSVHSLIGWLEKSTPKNTIVLILSFSVLLLLKAYMGVYLVLALLLVRDKYGPKFYKNIKLIYPFLLCVLPFLFWYLWAKQFPEGIPHFKWAFNGDKIRFKPSFFYWIFGIRIGTLILGIWGILPFIEGVMDIFKRKLGLFLYWIVAMLIYLFVVATANVRHDYYQAVLTPIVSILTAIGINRISKEGWYGKIIGIFCLGMMIFMGWKNISGYYQINHPEIIEAGKAVDELTPKDSLVVAPYDGDTAFLYQTNRKGWPYVTLPIGELIEKGADYYVSVNFDSQTNEFMGKYKTLKRTEKYIILDLSKPI